MIYFPDIFAISPPGNIHIPVKWCVEYKIDEFINKNELYDELIKTVIILLKG